MNYEECQTYLNKNGYIDRYIDFADRSVLHLLIHSKVGYLRFLPNELRQLIIDIAFPNTEFIPFNLKRGNAIVLDYDFQTALIEVSWKYFIVEKIRSHTSRFGRKNYVHRIIYERIYNCIRKMNGFSSLEYINKYIHMAQYDWEHNILWHEAGYYGSFKDGKFLYSTTFPFRIKLFFKK